MLNTDTRTGERQHNVHETGTHAAEHRVPDSGDVALIYLETFAHVIV